MYAQATLYDYWIALYSRKKIILVVSLSAMLFAIGISYYLPPIYEAKASLYMPANLVAPSFTGASSQKLAQVPLKPLPDEKEAGIHIGILRSEDLAEKVNALFPQKDATFFKKNVDFNTSPQFFIDIYERDRDPRLAAAVANAYVKVYTEFHSDVLKAEAQRARAVLETQLKDLDQQFAAQVDEIKEFKRRHNILSSAEAEGLLVSQSKKLEQDRNETQVEMKEIRERMSAQSAPLGARTGVREDDSIVSNPLTVKLRRLEAKNAALTERIQQLQEEGRDAVSTLSVLRTMELAQKKLEDLRTNVAMNLAEARLQSESPSVEVVQTQTARPPKIPGFPIFQLNAIVAFIFGFGAACYAALLLEYLKRLKLERIRRNLDESLLREAT